VTVATALVLEGERRLVPREFELPAIGDDDALLRVEACGLCGTDHELFTGAIAWPPGFVPGHETVGVIETIGPTAAARWQVSVGDRVAVGNRRACRECGPCRSGDLARCVRFGSPASYGMTSAAIAPGLWGGYATHHYLAPESVLHSVPPGLDAEVATLFNPVGAGLEWAVEIPGTHEGDVVAVLGPGVRGISAAAAAKAAGAAFVMVTGFGPADAPRLAVARQFGADLVVDVAVDDPVAMLRDAAGQLADVVVDVTAKSGPAFGQALELTERFARVVVAGIRGHGIEATFSPDIIPMRELRLLGASGVATDAHERAVHLVASGRFPFEALPRTTAGFSDVSELLATMAGETRTTPPMHAVFVPRP
jgi:alcohol dehydrogenase